MGRSPSPPRRRSLSPPVQRRAKRKVEDVKPSPRIVKRRVESGIGSLASHRANTCPFLLRVFLKNGQPTNPPPPEDATPSVNTEEFQVYVWMNVSLREVVDLMKDILVEARDPRARLTLKRKCHRSNKISEMGVLSSTYRSAVDRRTLRSFGFQIGDVIELSIHQPSANFGRQLSSNLREEDQQDIDLQQSDNEHEQDEDKEKETTHTHTQQETTHTHTQQETTHTHTQQETTHTHTQQETTHTHTQQVPPPSGTEVPQDRNLTEDKTTQNHQTNRNDESTHTQSRPSLEAEASSINSAAVHTNPEEETQRTNGDGDGDTSRTRNGDGDGDTSRTRNGDGDGDGDGDMSRTRNGDGHGANKKHNVETGDVSSKPDLIEMPHLEKEPKQSGSEIQERARDMRSGVGESADRSEEMTAEKKPSEETGDGDMKKGDGDMEEGDGDVQGNSGSDLMKEE